MAKNIFSLFYCLNFSFHLLSVVDCTKVASYEGIDSHSNYTDNYNPDDDAETFAGLPYYENKNLTFEKQVLPGWYLWPEATMHYEISKRISPFLSRLIRVAMDIIQNRTCVRFVEWDGEEAHDRVYFYTGIDPTCFSEGLGYIHQARQGIRLGDDCLPPDLKLGGIQHQILHALGIVNTHQRPDRDKYIEIFWNNVKRDRRSRSQMDILKNHDFATYKSVPYDYSSVMHYGNNALAINPMKPTMAHIGDEREVCLGQRIRVTECDLELIRRAYNCVRINSCKPYLNFKRREFPVFWADTCQYLW